MSKTFKSLPKCDIYGHIMISCIGKCVSNIEPGVKCNWKNLHATLLTACLGCTDSQSYLEVSVVFCCCFVLRV